jgi:hypothetical protein
VSSLKARRAAFVEHVRAECRKHGIRFILSPAEYVCTREDGCGGYFTDEPPVLCVATGRPRWVEMLAHEYSHMQQWLAEARVWRACKPIDEHFTDWTFGKARMSRRRVARVCRLTQSCELDCERRAVRLLQGRRLLDAAGLRRYVRESNAYVLLYEFIRLTGTWYGRRQNQVPGLMESMPDTFQRRSWYNRLPKGYAYRMMRWSLRPGQQQRALSRLVAGAAYGGVPHPSP